MVEPEGKDVFMMEAKTKYRDFQNLSGDRISETLESAIFLLLHGEGLVVTCGPH